MGYCISPQEIRGHIVPCRKCWPCKQWRQYQWQYRLTQEHYSAHRTWFCTWTSRHEIKAEQWTATWQKFMKRLRKTLMHSQAYQSPTVRYFTVLERGSKNSRLHLHSLMFCTEEIRRRDIEASWRDGYSKLKLCKPGHISYVAKYVTKESSRILASQNLGLLHSSLDFHPPWYRRMAIQRQITNKQPQPNERTERE